MKKSDLPSRNVRRRFFGPGTILALIVAVAIVASGWLTRGDQTPLRSGRIVYEADAHGRMRRVDAPSALALPAAPPLWKPEPGLLVAHAVELRLARSQRGRAEALASAWGREKAQWETEMQRALGGTGALVQQASPDRRLSLAQVRQGLSDYSAISRDYDMRRADTWAQAAALLTSAQRRQLDRLAQQRGTTVSTSSPKPGQQPDRPAQPSQEAK